MRLFFEKYARDNNFDPMEADNWYSESTKFTEIKVVQCIF